VRKPPGQVVAGKPEGNDLLSLDCHLYRRSYLRRAVREAEELLSQFDVLYPSEALVRLALRGAAAYDLPWFDAHMWAYAEYFGCEVLWSEGFQHERAYGTVTAIGPFRD
jgi:predicted nucleic acid-binding protein